MTKYCVLGTKESLDGLLKIGQVTYQDDFVGDDKVIYFLNTRHSEKEIRAIQGVQEVDESGIGSCWI